MTIDTITLPVLNDGEHYAGLILNDDGTLSHHLPRQSRPQIAHSVIHPFTTSRTHP